MISDIGMPDQDGYELIRKLRALPPEKGGKTPAIALTGYASRKDRERALSSGYQQHMAKPIEQVDMIAAIAALDWTW
jgi:CheY-like chemotaxis protein